MLTKKTRFAPSPSGFLHIGGARTALMNKLEAVRRGGLFVLRFEDTDQNRSSKRSIDAIINALQWLGINWDEGPGKSNYTNYIQSNRLHIYNRFAQILINREAAYPCFCSKERLDAIKSNQKGAKYDRRCRDIPRSIAQQRMEKEPYCVRIKNYDGAIKFNDIVLGKNVITNSTELDDFIIIRSNGYPMYNFSCVVDDHEMGITHIFRGSEHIVNTPKQIMIYNGLGAHIPTFGHLPIILDPNTRKKMSKRDDGVSIQEYMRDGYSPRAVNAYLITLGFNPKNLKQFTIEELAKKFDITKVKKSAAFHDLNRLKTIEKQVDKIVRENKWKPNVV